MEWADVPADRLDIPACLASGQCFRWRVSDEGEWRGVIGGTAVALRPKAEGFWWRTLPEPGGWDVLARYFALDVDLPRLHAEWTAGDPRIAPAVSRHPGLRILRQEPGEAFFSFLCATNNTIQKIRHTITRLAERYGEPVAEVDGETLFAFPTAERLAEAEEADLRGDLWGYRAPRLVALARHAATEGEAAWFTRLRALPYLEARAELASLFGIGLKVADCICLFGLGHDQAVPVDTHVRRIAARLFGDDLPARTLTPTVYNAIGERFRETFGPYAGWAQQALFFDELAPATAANKAATPR
jgi:N-glycosylase/DNA lyase